MSRFDFHPLIGALFHVRVVAAGVAAVIPVVRLRILRVDADGRLALNHNRRGWIGIMVRVGIPPPRAADHNAHSDPPVIVPAKVTAPGMAATLKVASAKVAAASKMVVGVERLAQVVVHPGRPALVAVLVERVRRQCDHRYGVVAHRRSLVPDEERRRGDRARALHRVRRRKAE